MTDQRIHKWFWRATGNMSLQEFMLLMSCGKHIPNIYYFDSQSRSAVQFSPGLLAWPVEYLLAFHSPKHVFGGRTRPSLRALNAWEHRLCWKLALQWIYTKPMEFSFWTKSFHKTLPFEIFEPSGEFLSRHVVQAGAKHSLTTAMGSST